MDSSRRKVATRGHRGGLPAALALDAGRDDGDKGTDPQPQGLAGTRVASRDALTLAYASGRTGTNQFDLVLGDDVLALRGAGTDFASVAGGEVEPAKLNLVPARQ